MVMRIMAKMKNKYVYCVCERLNLIDLSQLVVHQVRFVTTCKHGSLGTMLKSVSARCSSVVRAFAHGAMGCRFDPSWGGPIELFLSPASSPQLV